MIIKGGFECFPPDHHHRHMLGHVCPNPGRMGVKLVGPIEGGEDVRDRVTYIMVEHCSNGNSVYY